MMMGATATATALMMVMSRVPGEGAQRAGGYGRGRGQVRIMGRRWGSELMMHLDSGGCGRLVHRGRRQLVVWNGARIVGVVGQVMRVRSPRIIHSHWVVVEVRVVRHLMVRVVRMERIVGRAEVVRSTGHGCRATHTGRGERRRRQSPAKQRKTEIATASVIIVDAVGVIVCGCRCTVIR